MGTIERIQSTLDFIEEGLTGELHVDEIAEYADRSRYHYQRMFARWVGEPIMEYIRKRRLTLAGQELMQSQAPILEIALKYGYESHEGFCRAFREFHGVTPTQCRKYLLSRSFEKKRLGKGMRIMTDTDRRLSEEAAEASVRRLAESADAILRVLDSFSQKVGDGAELAARMDAQTPVPGAVFMQAARMTRSLADRAKERQGSIRAFLSSILEGLRPASAPEVLSQVMDALKTLDGLERQVYIIAMNVKLNVARTAPEYRGFLRGIEDTFMDLATATVPDAEALRGLAADFRRVVQGDIQAEMERCREAAAADMMGISNRCRAVSAFLRDEAQIKDAGGFCVIAGEIEGMASELAVRGDSLATATPVSWLAASERAESLLGACAERIDIYAGIMEMELCRTPDARELGMAMRQACGLAEAITRGWEAMRDRRDEMVRLETLLTMETIPEPYAQRSMAMADQARILDALLRVEHGKFLHAAQDKWLSALEPILGRSGEIARGLAAFAGDGDAMIIKERVCDLGRDVGDFAAELSRLSLGFGTLGDVFQCIAGEYGFLSRRIDGLANM